MRWLITNRKIANGTFGKDFAPLSFWTLDETANPTTDMTQVASWTRRTAAQFQADLVMIANSFPAPMGVASADQKHVALFVHGYNQSFAASTNLYDTVAKTLFDGPSGLGVLVSFDWPSEGSLLGYLPDRAQARKTGDDLTNVLTALYDWMAPKQAIAAKDPSKACKARTSLIAHSMGNYALEYAMNELWTRKNRPLLSSLLLEVLMVAADVDNDLFRSGDKVTHGDGEGLANLSYRITALYTGKDDVLGASAGLKHFGKRRLGRSGLDQTCPLPDNVWDVDCTTMFQRNPGPLKYHGEYFDPSETTIAALMKSILQGTDRSVLIHEQLVPAALMKTQPTP